MNKVAVSLLFIIISSVRGASSEGLGDEFDNVDVDEVLSNKRLVDNYVQCAKTGQKCTPEGLKFRELVPEHLKTDCGNCTPQEKEKVMKIIEWVIQNRPNDFLDIESIHDPNHSFRATHGDTLKDKNISLPPLP